MNDKVKVWVSFSRIPFIYWTVTGCCFFYFALETLTEMFREIYDAACKNELISNAIVFIEMGTLELRPTVIMTAIYAYSLYGMARVIV